MTISYALASAGQFGQQPSAPIAGIPLDVTLDNSYPAGGYPFDADAVAQKQWGSQNAIPNQSIVAEARLGYEFEYDRANKKLKVLKGAAALGNLALSVGAVPDLAVGTGSAAKVKQQNTVSFLSGGVFKSKTTQEIAFTAVTHDIPANALSVQERLFLVTLDATGAGFLTAGAIATGAGNAQAPAIPSGQTLIGTVRIAVNAGAPGAGTNFVAGTTSLADARLTTTYVDAAILPGLGGGEVPSGTDLSAIAGANAARLTLVAR